MRWVYDIAGACAGLACALLIAAGRLERSGRRELAIRIARHAGFLAAGAGALQLLAAAGVSWGGPVRAAAAVAAVVACAGIALLAGLARKPRPSCWFAAGAWIVAALLRVAS